MVEEKPTVLVAEMSVGTGKRQMQISADPILRSDQADPIRKGKVALKTSEITTADPRSKYSKVELARNLANWRFTKAPTPFKAIEATNAT